VTPRVWIEPWTADDRELLGALLGDPRMTEHLGGPESDEKLDARQARYEGNPRQHRIRVEGEHRGVGWVGYWEREWRGEQVWEVGWAVRPEFQGRGLATHAMRLLLDVIRKDGSPRSVHAYPSVDNGASNAVARKLGFEQLGPFDFEYPPGSGQTLRCNDWRLDLEANPNERSEPG
jgi:RimJ/RimL family protein N-acetyltransferase